MTTLSGPPIGEPAAPVALPPALALRGLTKVFAGTTGGGFTTWIYQVVGLIGQVVLLTPVAALVLWGILGDVPSALWLTLVVGPVWGYLAARFGVGLGARQLDRHGPELLSTVTPRGL